MAQDGVPRWFWPDQHFGLRIADDGSVDLVSLDGVVSLSILADGTLVGASKRAESFADPVAAISEQIHSRSFSARALKMFDLVDTLESAEDRAGAAHECAIALRQHAGVPFFGKSSHSMWAQTVTNWTDGT